MGILHPKRIAQVKDFSGLAWDTITPTDIDMSLDFKGKLFVFVDFKYKDAPFPVGQRKHLEYLVNAIHKSKSTTGPFAIAGVAIHSQDIGTDIACKSALVETCFWNGKWWLRNQDVLEFVDCVAKHYGLFDRPTVSCKMEVAQKIGLVAAPVPVWDEEKKGYPESWVMCDSERYSE
jgi:hypothetical protein